MENTESKLAKAIKKTNDEAEEKVARVITENQLYLEAPKKHQALRRQLGWDEKERVAGKALNESKAESNIRDSYKGEVIYSEQQLVELCIDHDYRYLALDEYKYKTSDKILDIIQDYMLKHKIPDIGKFKILCPAYVVDKMNELDVHEVIEYRESDSSEELVLVYQTIESVNTDENYYSILTTIGNVKDKRSVINKFFSYKTLTHTFSEMRLVFDIIMLAFTIVSVLIILSSGGKFFAVDNYAAIFAASAVILSVYLFLTGILSSQFTNEDFRYQKSLYYQLIYRIKKRVNDKDALPIIKKVQAKETKWLLTYVVSLLLTFNLLFVGIVETIYYVKSTKNDTWLIYSTDQPDRAHAYYVYTAFKRTGFLEYKKHKFNSYQIKK